MTLPCPSLVVQQLVVGLWWLWEHWGHSQLEHTWGGAARGTEMLWCIISQLWSIFGGFLVLEWGVQLLGHGAGLGTQGDMKVGQNGIHSCKLNPLTFIAQRNKQQSKNAMEPMGLADLSG